MESAISTLRQRVPELIAAQKQRMEDRLREALTAVGTAVPLEETFNSPAFSFGWESFWKLAKANIDGSHAAQWQLAELLLNPNKKDLQTQIEGTENRIALARRNFNDAVNGFNAYIRRFPTNLLAGVFGFSPKGYFQATTGAEKAPDLNQKFGQ
jgi:hypothetical protein